MRRGFTLIELMVVVAVLGILSLIIIPIVDKNIKRSKDDLYKIQIENIRLAGINYFTDNITLRPKSGDSYSVDLSDLVSDGYIGDVVDPKTGEDFTESLSVVISNSDGTYSYLVCPIEDGCE